MSETSPRRHGAAALNGLVRLGGLGLLALLAGCRQGGLQACTDLLDAKRYAAAAARCERVYAAEGDPRAGVAAARAHRSLGHSAEVLAWKDRLVKAGQEIPGIWSVVAAVHLEQGETERAEQEYRHDLALSRAAGDHQRAAAILYRLFYLSWEEPDSHRKTFLLASQALQEAAKAGDRDLQARAAQAVYTVLFEIGDLQGARRALEIAKPLIDGRDLVSQAYLLSNLGTVLFAEGRLALARHHFERALELGAGNPDREFLFGVHLNLTWAYLELGEIDRAAHHLEEASKQTRSGSPESPSLLFYRARVDLARGRLAAAAKILATAISQNPPPYWMWELEYYRGLVEEARHNLSIAEAAYSKSIKVVERLRETLVFDDLKSWLLDEKRQPFEALFRLQARAGRAEQALATAERAQARTFIDAFLHASSATAAAMEKRWSPEASLERMQGLESVLSAMSQSPVASLQPIDQVLAAFGGRHGLVYFEAGGDLWLLSVSGQRVRLHSLPASAGEVRRSVDRFLANPGDAATAQRLGEVLLPQDSLPEKGKPIHVAADGVLGNLPFAALRREGRYLVEDHAIVLIPSLSALVALEARRREPAGPPIVIADPRGDLPAATSEAVSVKNVLGGKALIAGQATAGELSKASRSQALHLATHTGSGPRGPWLQLADRRVTAGEIVAGRIGPRVTVLASCASGVRPGRQMWGSLGAAFLAAGSRAVLASLWSIEDEPAREFVLRFYAEGGVSDPAGALARTQRVAIARGQPPLYWGPFVLFGSERPLDDIH